MTRILGVDYGRRRIGIAVSDESGVIATPVRVIEMRAEKAALHEIRTICKEKGAERIVLGLPVRMNGTSGPAAEEVEAFAVKLQECAGVPVETYDERLSTAMVERTLLDADMSRQKRKSVRDKLAAQVILQGYLDRMNNQAHSHTDIVDSSGQAR